MLAGVSTRRYARTAEPVGTDVENKDALDVKIVGVSRAFVERTQRGARGADGTPPRRRRPSRADARRNRAEGRLQSITQSDPGRLRPGRGRSSAVSATKNATCSSTSRSAVGLRSSVVSAKPGPTLTTSERSINYTRSLPSSNARIPAPLARSHEGLEETLSLTRLGIRGNLKRTLESTNPCESMIEICRPRPRQTRRRNRTRTPSADRPDPEQGARYRPHRLTITPGPPPRKSTAAGTPSGTLPSPRERRREDYNSTPCGSLLCSLY